MNPFQHGEVYVTDDGAETDLDLGNYSRFTTSPLGRDNSITTGQIYQAVISREREGRFLGKTVQVIPHITDEIKARIFRVGEQPGVDVTMVEIGGTVGDIESIPFLEAARQFIHDIGRENVMFVHLTLVPVVYMGEPKTKPTQHSVRELREIGIQPDVLLDQVPRPPRGRPAAQDLALHQRRQGGGALGPRRAHHDLRDPPRVRRAEARRDHRAQAAPAPQGAGTGRLARVRRPVRGSFAHGEGRHRGQVHGPARLLHLHLRGPDARRGGERRPRGAGEVRGRGPGGRQEPGGGLRGLRRHAGARRLRQPGHRGDDPGRHGSPGSRASPTSASASACRSW